MKNIGNTLRLDIKYCKNCAKNAMVEVEDNGNQLVMHCPICNRHQSKFKEPQAMFVRGGKD